MSLKFIAQSLPSWRRGRRSSTLVRLSRVGGNPSSPVHKARPDNVADFGVGTLGPSFYLLPVPPAPSHNRVAGRREPRWEICAAPVHVQAGMGPLPHNPFTPSASTLRRVVSRGPHSSVFGEGPTPVLATELRGPSSLNRYDASATCGNNSTPVLVCPCDSLIPRPNYPLCTIQLPTMEHPCPILFRPVPPQIRTVAHRLSHLSVKCSIAQIRNWNTLEHNGTAHTRNPPLLTTPAPLTSVEIGTSHSYRLAGCRLTGLYCHRLTACGGERW